MLDTAQTKPATFSRATWSRESILFAGYYFCSIAFYGMMVCLPLHCRALHFQPGEIAVVTAGGYLAGIIGGPLALYAAHHFWPARGVFLAAGLLALASFLPIFDLREVWSVTGIWTLCFIFARGHNSLAEAQAVRAAAEKRLVFEHVRLMGSVGYVLAMGVWGWAYDAFGSTGILGVGAGVLTATAASICLMLPQISAQPGKVLHALKPALSGEAPWSIFPFACLIGAAAINAAAHAAPYTYLSIYLSEIGWSGSRISLAWNIGVAAEIGMFLLFTRLRRRFSLWFILRISFAMALVRWLLLYSYSSPGAILCAQALHAFSFAAAYLATAHLTFQLLPNHLRDRGQGLVASANGLGIVVGTAICGYLAEEISSLRDIPTLFMFSSICAALAWTSAMLPAVLKNDRLGTTTGSEGPKNLVVEEVP